MKAILIPIKPIWCVKIMNGDKLIEIRTSKALYKATIKLIEEQGYATFFMYCSKANQKDWHLIEVVDTDTGKRGYEYDYCIGSKGYLDYCLEGKVVAKFTVRKVEEIVANGQGDLVVYHYKGQIVEMLEQQQEIMRKSCLTFAELDKYLQCKNGYAHHIEDLVIFDKPKELGEFHTLKCEIRKYPCSLYKLAGCNGCQLTKAPQNFVFVESEE